VQDMSECGGDKGGLLIGPWSKDSNWKSLYLTKQRNH